MVLIRTIFTFVFIGFIVTTTFLENAQAETFVVSNGEKIQSKLASLQPGDTLLVRAGTYNESLSFESSGMPGKPVVLAAYPGETPTVIASGTVLTLSEKWCVVDGLVFDADNGSKDAVIMTSKAANNVVRNCEFRNGQRDGFDIDGGAADNIIENNVIHDFFKAGTDAHGIVTNPGVLRLQILNNTIYDCSGDCIQLYAEDSHDPSEYSKDVVIRGNTFYTTLGSNSENALDFKGIDGCVVAENDMFGFDNKAFVIQKGCRNLTIEDNEIHDSQRGMELRGEGGHSQENMVIRRNFIYNIGDFYAVKFDWVDNVEFVNNTLAFVEPAAITVEEEGVTNGVFKNNLFYQTGKPKIKGDFESEVSNNGWFGSDAGDLSGANDVTGADPMFVAANNYDFSLRDASPVVDMGADVGLDFAGSAPDIGAHELGGVPTSVGEETVTGVPQIFQLEPNSPNPFVSGAGTRFTFNLQKQSPIELRVYDILGRIVYQASLGNLPQGRHEVRWDGRTNTGNLAAAGAYFYEFRGEIGRFVSSMLILK